MTGNLRTCLLAASLGAAILAPSGPARADRFTSHLDGLEAELTTRGAALADAALAGPLTKPQKAELKACTKGLKILSKETLSLEDETRNAGKVAAAVEKAFAGDAGLDTLLSEAAGALEDDVSARLDGLSSSVADRPDSKAKDRAWKALAAASTLFDQSQAEVDVVLRLKLLFKALKKAKAAEKFLAGGGGGGGAGCYAGSRTPTAGEHMTASWSGGSFTGAAVKATAPASIGDLYRLTFYQCVNGGDDLAFTVYFVGIGGVGPYDYGSLSPFGVAYSVGDADGFTQSFGGRGTLTFTTYDEAGGNFAGTFSFTSNSAGVDTTDGAFQVSNVH